MKKIFSLFSTLFLVVTGGYSSTLITYWDMDAPTIAGKLTPNAGTQQNIAAQFWDLTVGFHGDIQPDAEGTTVNIPDTLTPNDPNYAVDFEQFFVLYEDGGFSMSGFDFSAYDTVEVSFAYRSGTTFTWENNLDVGYNLNDGHGWINLGISDFYSNIGVWETANVIVPMAAGRDNVDLRIHTTTLGSISSYLEIDNVQITAIPEPSLNALLSGIFLLLLCFYNRNRK